MDGDNVKDCQQLYRPTEVGSHEYKMRLVTGLWRFSPATISHWLQVKSRRGVDFKLGFTRQMPRRKSDFKGMGIRTMNTSEQLLMMGHGMLAE